MPPTTGAASTSAATPSGPTTAPATRYGQRKNTALKVIFIDVSVLVVLRAGRIIFFDKVVSLVDCC